MPDDSPFVKLARRVSVGVAVTAVLTCALVLPGQITVWLLASARTWSQLTDAMALGGVLTMVFGLVALISWVVTGIGFFRWLARARANIDQIPGVTPRYKRDWVVAAWFLPVVNVVLPGLVVGEVARASGIRRAGLVVWSWWAWFVASAAALVVPMMRDGGYSTQSMAFFTLGDAVDPAYRAALIALYQPRYDSLMPAFAALSVAAVLAIVMVRTITAAQAGRDDLAAAPAPPSLVPLRRLALLATAAVVVVTAVLLSPALLPDPDGALPPASVSEDRGAPDEGNTAAPELSATVAVSYSYSEMDPFTPVGMVAWLLLGGGVACFLWWLARARRNLDAFSGAAPRFRAGWSLAAWFVPGAGPVLGGMVVSDIARESHPAGAGESAGPVNTPARYEAVRLVWAWLVVSLLWPLTYPPLWESMPLAPPTVGWLPATVALVIAALLAIAVIRRVTVAQHHLADDQALPPEPPEE